MTKLRTGTTFLCKTPRVLTLFGPPPRWWIFFVAYGWWPPAWHGVGYRFGRLRKVQL